MGWNISVRENTLVIPEAFRERFVAEAEDHYQNAYITDDGHVEFDIDAMEHMDFLWDSWVTKIQQEMNAEGDVVFQSAEGDNAGEIWGYRFKKNGEIVELESFVTMVEVR